MRDRISKVIVGESNGIRYSCDEAFERTGIKKATTTAGGEVLNFSNDQLIEIKTNGLYLKKIKLSKTLLEADVLITVPVIKTHEMTTLSCALKNQFGCIPDKNRILYHHHLNEVIVDINKVLNPKLVITDGLICMEGNGPIRGPTRKIGCLIASNNVLANDVIVSSKIMGVDPKTIKHLVLAAKEKLGPIDIEQIERIGSFDFAHRNFTLPSPDLVSKVMLKTYKSQKITWLLYVSPLFNLMNRFAQLYRKLK